MPVLEPRDPFAPPADEDPTILGPLAERDPNAPDEESAEYAVTGAASFDEVLRRTRRQGFVAGAAAGGLAGAVVAAVFALAGSRAGPGAIPFTVPAEVAVLEPAAPEPAPAPPAPSPARSPRAATPSTAVVAARFAPQPLRAPPPVPEASADRADAAEPPPSAVARVPPAAAPGAPDAVAAVEAPDPSPAAEATPAPRPPQERDVTAALAARRDDLDACVAETPGDGTASHGRRFRMLVVVEPSGAVSEARPYDEEIAATPLGVCLARLAKETSFPAFEGEPARIEVKVRADD